MGELRTAIEAGRLAEYRAGFYRRYRTRTDE
jgi:hypothetical protein